MHISKYDKGYTRRHFMESAGKASVGAGMLAPLWDVICRDGDITKAYPEEAMDIEALTNGKVKVGGVIDASNIDSVRDLVIERLGREVETVQPEIEAFIEDKVDVGKMVEDKLAKMPKPEFEGILRGLFEKDEWILITIGGALGGGVGFAQAAVVLSLAL